MNNSYIRLSELQARIEQALKQSLPKSLWVIAEINEISVNFKGHCYLELIEKNENTTQITAKQRATIWSYSYSLINSYFKSETGIPLQAGLKVLLQCSVEFHALYGMSLIITNIDPVYTLGEEEKQRREIIERLRFEGIIDMNKLLELPTLMQRIAIISSETAAGYQDFMQTLHNNRMQLPFTTTLFNAAMQGAEVEQSVVAALETIFKQEQNFDVVVIIRGGGAKTDLRYFDNYSIATHIAQFPLAVITGIGHDKDISIADMVAHTALKTPTAVAEFLIDHMSNVVQHWQELYQRLTTSCATIAERHRSALADYKQQLEMHSKHRIENETLRLRFAQNQLIQTSKTTIAHTVQQVEIYKKQLKTTTQYLLHKQQQTLHIYETKITANSIDYILSKGFTLTTDAQGKRLQSAVGVQSHETIRTYFSDGLVESITK
ncbi:MAG: exodeoxyribonuclease VII large subunit [Bacteroidales bacterium]|jgi:exodeoxyribonuclease VII large subunit|nr:exodeoxyribonuclease VII large subunit [Bacteroidales bacterium]